MSREDGDQFRRIEVFTGLARRRSWSRDEKGRIVAESDVGGETVSAVARRHGISAQQLFGWRRAMRGAAGGAPPLFVPAVLARPAHVAKHGARHGMADAAVIELDVCGVAIRIGRGADVQTVTAVLLALKAAR